jgi:hypothetical protein
MTCVASSLLLLLLRVRFNLAGAAYARPAGVNRPELLPTEQTPVIDVAGFLTPSEVRRNSCCLSLQILCNCTRGTVTAVLAVVMKQVHFFVI